MIAKASKPLALKRRTLSTKQSQQHNTAFGHLGEELGVTFLQHKGYVILDRNVRFGTKEIDIIARDKDRDEIVFIEVKNRENQFFGDPSQAVTSKKLQSLQLVAKLYCKANHISANYRFDILSIISGTISHYENVTWGRRR